MKHSKKTKLRHEKNNKNKGAITDNSNLKKQSLKDEKKSKSLSPKLHMRKSKKKLEKHNVIGCEDLEIYEFDDSSNESDNSELLADVDQYMGKLNFNPLTKSDIFSKGNVTENLNTHGKSKNWKLKKEEKLFGRFEEGSNDETNKLFFNNKTIKSDRVDHKEISEVLKAGKKKKIKSFGKNEGNKKKQSLNCSKKYGSAESLLPNEGKIIKYSVSTKKRQTVDDELLINKHTSKKLCKDSLINKLYGSPNTQTKTLFNSKDLSVDEPKSSSKFPASTIISNEKEAFKAKLQKQLQSASFRILNEKLYTTSGSDAYSLFQEDPDSFKIYHEGYRTQVSQWPVNPVQLIASWLRKKPKNWIVADFGCGEAILSKSVPQKVLSIDLIATNSTVIECDMSNTPLKSKSIHVAVFCLSLMGTNLTEFIIEANRVLADSGILKIAEVESRFNQNLSEFFRMMTQLGFKCIHKNQNQKYFWLFDFLKVKDVKKQPNIPALVLKPCLYKKR